MVKKLNDIKPVPDDGDDDQPELDMSKPLGVQANARTYGKVELPDDGREVIKPIALDKIAPDPAQPRRIVPVQVIKAAAQDGIPVWMAWHRISEQLHGGPINLKNIFRGESDGFENEPTHGIVKGFMGLVALAADIARIKQTNAITVVYAPDAETGVQYQIETGERRWMALNMLYGVTGKEKFSKIKARIVEKSSVWRQASENGAREKLTAIAKARQMALLLMDWYHENRGINFLPYRELVPNIDVCDRVFYAQVADGQRFKVPDGQGSSFLEAIDLPSKGQLSRIRALLDAPDDVWLEADENDWAEFKIRSEMDARSNSVRLPTGNHADEKSPANPFGVQPPMSIKKGEGAGTKATNERMLYRGQEVEYVTSDARKGQSGLEVLIWHLDQDGNRTYTETVRHTDLHDLPHPERGQPTGSATPAPFVAPKISYDAIGPHAATRLEVGQWRKSLGGRIFEILSILANEVSVVEISPATGKRMSAPYGMHIGVVAGYEIVSKDTPSSHQQIPVQHVVVSEEPEQAADNPSSANQDDGEPPEWAKRGITIVHSLTGAIGTIEGTIWDDKENRRYARVKFGPDDFESLPIDECTPTDQRPEETSAPTSRPRHPGMEAANLKNMISPDQGDLQSLKIMAAGLRMNDDAANINSMATMSPYAIDTFLRDEGYEGAQARIDAYLQSCSDVLHTEWQKAQAVHASQTELLRQKHEAQQAL